SRSRSKLRVEIRSELHVFMEERGSVCQFFRRIVFKERPYDRALWKLRRLSECVRWKYGGCCADSHYLERLPAIQSLEKYLGHSGEYCRHSCQPHVRIIGL